MLYLLAVHTLNGTNIHRLDACMILQNYLLQLLRIYTVQCSMQSHMQTPLACIIYLLHTACIIICHRHIVSYRGSNMHVC